MTSARDLRLPPALRHRPTGPQRPLAERLLRGAGADPAFLEDVLGDLAEDFARRHVTHGPVLARLWYLWEAARSAPHLLGNALRHGGARGRARVAAAVALVALVPAVVALGLLLRDGPPVQLVMDGQGGRPLGEGLVVNTRHPVRLAMRVLDARGRALSARDVRYRWLSGAPLSITAAGVVVCATQGDAVIRATLGGVATTIPLLCRPVKRLLATSEMRFVVGDSGRDFAFVALDAAQRAVTPLAGEVRVDDSTVATLHGSRVTPMHAGRTSVTVRIGDVEASSFVTVFERVPSLDRLRAEQRLVVAPVRVGPADTLRWRLPYGQFSLTYQPTRRGEPYPRFATRGLVMCMPDFGPDVEQVTCLARERGTTIRLTHPVARGAPVTGALWLTRWPDP